jgi:hypothetical protein
MEIKLTVDDPKDCPSNDHFYNMLADGTCFSCGAVWGLSDERGHLPAPTDREINQMYALAESDSKNYITAHD